MIVKGISFPFRIGNKGGVVMSSTENNSYLHAVEAIQQVLSTKVGERVMNPTFGSNLDLELFDNTDISGKNLLIHDIKKAINDSCGDFLSIRNVTLRSVNHKVIMDLSFNLIGYSEIYKTEIKVGDNIE